MIKCISPCYPGPGLSDGLPLLCVGDGTGHHHKEVGRVAGGRAHCRGGEQRAPGQQVSSPDSFEREMSSNGQELTNKNVWEEIHQVEGSGDTTGPG